MKQQSLTAENKWIYFFIGLAVLVNFSGLFVPLMDPDAGVYASISKNMLLRNNYWELYFQGNDWLDKPHFPFWITAFFFEIFGLHTWSYKLPGILFVLLGAYYTYLFAKQLYNKTIALWAVFILLTAEHIIISNNDVRAEPFLTGLIIASIYHFYNSFKKNISWHLVAGSVFAACAVMTKGVFTLIPVGGAIIAELVIKKDWKNLFHWRWVISLILVSIFIAPELYSLWYQFDNHPEKTVFGKTNVSGIKFFLWDSQFGRFLNTGPIKGKGDPFFFVHTLLWAFLPWSLIMYASVIDKFRKGTKKINYRNEEWLTISGSLLTLFVFSFSKFQLPYYSNIIFPLLAILTAKYIWKIQTSSSPALRIILNSITVILVIGGVLLQYFYSAAMPSVILLVVVAAVVFLMIAFQRWFKVSGNLTAFYRTGLAVIALNLYINWFFYPDLLKYQSGSEAAFYLNKELAEIKEVHAGTYAPVFEFYVSAPSFRPDTAVINKPGLLQPGYWYLSKPEMDLVQQRGIKYEVIKELDDFHVTMLTGKFINKKTRSQQLKKCFIIRIL